MIPSIRINETAPTIATLHKMMELLNLPVDGEEKKEQRAGEKTQASIRKFQEKNKLHFDENYVVDRLTIDFITGCITIMMRLIVPMWWSLLSTKENNESGEHSRETIWKFQHQLLRTLNPDVRKRKNQVFVKN